MHKLSILFILAISLFVIACGGAEEDADDSDTTTEEEKVSTEENEASEEEPVVKSCEGETNLKVEGADFAFDNFEVKDYRVNRKRGSRSVEIILANYDMSENPGSPTADQVKLVMRFDRRAPKDDKDAKVVVTPGDYYYHAESEEEKMYYFISEFNTKDGKAYLTWSMGKDNPAVGKITNITEDEVCGEIEVASGLDGKNKQIIQGTFYLKGDKMEKDG